MFRKVISQLPKAAVFKQVRSLATPSTELAFGSTKGSIAGGGAGSGSVSRAETSKVATSLFPTTRGSNYFQFREATINPTLKDAKKPIRQGVLENLYF